MDRITPGGPEKRQRAEALKAALLEKLARKQKAEKLQTLFKLAHARKQRAKAKQQLFRDRMEAVRIIKDT